jgi:hypothetical protein
MALPVLVTALLAYKELMELKAYKATLWGRWVIKAKMALSVKMECKVYVAIKVILVIQESKVILVLPAILVYREL